jgi:ferric iron reductase protein FhuF
MVADLSSRLPAQLRAMLAVGAGEQEIPAARIAEPDWLAGQVRAQCSIWHTEDRHLLGTLWWYSASTVLLTPALVSLAVTGQAFSPRLADLVLHRDRTGLLPGAHATAVLSGDLPQLASALRDMLGTTIAAVTAVSGGRDRPLWAIAADAMANRLLLAGTATGRVEQACAIATALSSAIGPPLPVPRYVDIGGRRFVRRVSCCQLYRLPDQQLCTSCPRRASADRMARLLALTRPG